MKRALSIVSALAIALIALSCSDLLDPATSLGSDILGINPQNEFLHFSGELEVGQTSSMLDRDSSEFLSGLHKKTGLLKVGSFIAGSESSVLRTRETSIAYVEFAGKELQKLLRASDSLTVDSLVVTAAMRDKDTTIKAATPPQGLRANFSPTRLDRFSYRSTQQRDSAIGTTLGADSVSIRFTAPVSALDVNSIQQIVNMQIEEKSDTTFDTTYIVPVHILYSADTLLSIKTESLRLLAYYHVKEDTTVLSRDAGAVYWDYAVTEDSDSLASVDTQACSSAGPGRYAVIPIAFSTFWDAMHDTTRGVRFSSVLGASFPVRIAASRIHRDTLVFYYLLSAKSNLKRSALGSAQKRADRYNNPITEEGNDEVARAIERTSTGLPITVPPTTVADLPISDMLIDIMTESQTLPDTLYLYLALAHTGLFGSIKWDVGTKIGINAVFTNPEQE